MGLGGLAGTSRQYVGMPGMHGTYEANMSMQHCDVLIAVGARFDDRGIGNTKHFAQNPRKIVHIDIDPSSISNSMRVDVPSVDRTSVVDGKRVSVRVDLGGQRSLKNTQKPTRH